MWAAQVPTSKDVKNGENWMHGPVANYFRIHLLRTKESGVVNVT